MQTTRLTDQRTGVEETIAYLEGSMFTRVYRPRVAHSAGVVICSPLLAELARGYRREVLLARALAARGIAVARFHYRGAGHSRDAPAEPTFESMVEDVVAATECLRTTLAVRRMGFVATRAGSLPAAAAAARFPGAPVCWWAPAIDSVSYFSEVFRFARMGALKRGSRAAQGTSPLAEIERLGRTDVVGYWVTRELHGSFDGRSLEAELGTKPRSVLNVQIDWADSLLPQYVALEASWKRQGFDVRSEVIAKPVAWWFGGEVVQGEDDAFPDEQVVGLTSDWIVDRLGQVNHED